MIRRCSICDPKCRLVLGDGPVPCDVLLIGEKPGKEEDARKKVFCGSTGQELNNTYLGLAGLERQTVRITNVLKCRLGGNNNKPTDQQIRACATQWISEEVVACRPNLIVLLGSTACSLVPKISLELDHGYPVRIGSQDSKFFGGWEGWVVPMYHPASGLHDTGQMIPMLDDWGRLGKWLKRKWEPPKPPIEGPVYILLNEVPKSGPYQALIPWERPIYVDTERDGPTTPWSVQWSYRPNLAFMALASNEQVMEHIRPMLSGAELVLHNAGQDIDMLEKMGIRVNRFRDTMQEAYHIGNLPQGLKALGWRLLGVRMRSWRDVVMPHSRQKMIEWLIEQWNEASEHRDLVEIKLKTKTKILRKPTPRECDLKRMISHSHKPEYDLWKKAEEIGLRGYPEPSIAHVPLEEVVQYACQDADVTGRIALELERIRRGLMKKEWNIPEQDWDA